MKKYTLLILLLMSSGLSQIAQAAWKIQESGFFVEKVLKRNSGKNLYVVKKDTPSEYYYDSYAFTNHLELSGRIEIKEYDSDTISHRITIVNNVFILVDSYGLMLRTSTIHNLYIPLSNLTGKPLSAIFNDTFYGGRLGFGFGLIAGFYPNYSLLANENGVVVPDVEKIFRAWDGGIGAEMSYVKMKFNTKSLANNGHSTITVTSGSDSINLPEVRVVPLNQAMNQVIGE